jgi:hypothetical protein
LFACCTAAYDGINPERYLAEADRIAETSDNEKLGLLVIGVATAVGGVGGFRIAAPLMVRFAPAGPAVAATVHGTQRLADRTRLTPDGARDVVANATRQLVQSDGAKVFIKEINGKFNVVVQGERGVITTFRNITQKALDRLAKNYGWEPK